MTEILTEYNKLNEAGIEIPFNQLVLHKAE